MDRDGRFRYTQNTQSGMKNKRQELNYYLKSGFNMPGNSLWGNLGPKYKC